MEWTKENENKVADIIKTLKELDADGETMQHILEAVGMEDQVYGQLDNHNLQHRLILIQDDVMSLTNVLKKAGIDIEDEVHEGVAICTYLSNIEISADLNDDESNNWGVLNKGSFEVDEKWAMTRGSELMIKNKLLKEKEYRKTWRHEVLIKAKSPEEAKEKWEQINLGNLDNDETIIDHAHVEDVSFEDENYNVII